MRSPVTSSFEHSRSGGANRLCRLAQEVCRGFIFTGVSTDAHTRYCPPAVTDYGDLVSLTAASHLLLGQAGVSDLTFSPAVGNPGVPDAGSDPGTGNGTSMPTADPVDFGGDSGAGGGGEGGDGGDGGSGGGGSSGGGSAGGAAGAGAAGGGSLPFTGMAVAAASAVGGALVATGTALRRFARRDG